MTEFLITGIAFIALSIGFDDDEFEADEEIRLNETVEQKIIGIDAVESDVAFASDLGIRAARFFEMDRELGWFHGRRVLALTRRCLSYVNSQVPKHTLVFGVLALNIVGVRTGFGTSFGT